MAVGLKGPRYAASLERMTDAILRSWVKRWPDTKWWTDTAPRREIAYVDFRHREKAEEAARAVLDLLANR